MKTGHIRQISILRILSTTGVASQLPILPRVGAPYIDISIYRETFVAIAACVYI
jgi:hypothetical protein